MHGQLHRRTDLLRRGLLALALTGAVLASCAAQPSPSIGSTPNPARGDTVANHWGRNLEYSFTDVAYGPKPFHRLDVLPYDTRYPTRRGTIVFVHGGAFTTGDRSQLLSGDLGALIHQRARGWDLVTIDYQVGANTYPAAYSDVALAVSWVRRHGASLGLDTGKIVLAGHSAGGSLAAMVATTPGASATYGPVPRVDAWVSISGLHDWQSGRYISDPWGMPVADRVARSTITTLDRTDPPGYLVHADLDPIVRVMQSELLFARAQAVGADVQFDRVDSGPAGCRYHDPLCGANVRWLDMFLL